MVRLLLSSVVATSDRLLRLVGGHHLSGSCVVITYHSVSEESRSPFGQQLDYMLCLANPLRIGGELELERGRRYVAVTVDDCFRGFVETGLPELRRREIPVTLFAPTGYLGRKSSWRDYGGRNEVGEEVASAEDLRQIAKSKTVDFGSHSVNHADLTLLAEEQARDELRRSKEALEEIVGREVIALSFPYGSCGARELRLAREAGYRFCFDSTPGALFSKFKAGLIGRVDVQPTDSRLEFGFKVLGAYRWIRWASAWKRRLLGRQGSSLRKGGGRPGTLG